MSALMKTHEEYIRSEGLDRIVDFSANADYKESVFDQVDGSLKIPDPPQSADLVRLHKLIRQRKSFTVLEFGVGYSTLVIADALQKNRLEWAALPDKPPIRNRFMFQLFSVDASPEWIEKVKAGLPEHLRPSVHFHHAGVEIGTHNGRLCHFYETLPDIVPDFIYLDGPSPKDVKGSIRGLSFQCYERTVMGADLLLMEPTFLPGTFILVDGRTNNARFLEKNFQRDYRITWDKEGDVTTFELMEERLGKYNLLGTDFLGQKNGVD